MIPFKRSHYGAIGLHGANPIVSQSRLHEIGSGGWHDVVISAFPLSKHEKGLNTEAQNEKPRNKLHGHRLYMEVGRVVVSSLGR